MLVILIIVLCVGLSKTDNLECSAFEKLLPWKDCVKTDETKIEPVKKPCNYLRKLVFGQQDCNEVIEASDKCNKWKNKLPGNSYCEYNPDIYLDVPQIIARHGYESETHVVVTEDGYLLKVHRIPNRRTAGTNQPIFLQHGLLGSSADWIINGNNSLAFLLADSGYDVWLGNARGNTYSKAHVSLPVKHPTFWNFSFNEMGTKDLPSVVTYISKVTRKPGEIIYVGHSMGTTMFYIFASEYPQVAKNIQVMVGLAPTAYMTHITSPIKYFAPYSNKLDWIRQLLGFNEFLPNNVFLKIITRQCQLFNVERHICENVMFSICGYEKDEFNVDILPVLLNKDPAGASTKTIIHFLQEINNEGNFQKFDYGINGNMIEYGTECPPSYNISNIRNPIYLMYSMNDWLASSIDVRRLAKELKNLEGVYKVKMDTFSHVDYVFGKDAEKLVYKPMLKFLSNFTESLNDSYSF